MKILIADDDERILRLLSDFFRFNKYEVVIVTDGEQALEKFKSQIFDLIILDVMMPIYDGWIVCKEIRKTSSVPIIILTAKDSDLDELFGFDIGADDYVSKPFKIELLLARVKRLLKNNNIKAKNNILNFKGIEVDQDKHLVKLDNRLIDLSPKEYELLIYFINNVNRVINRETLLRVIWKEEYLGDTRTVDTHINRLRNKLEYYAVDLRTIRGFGYKLGEE
ncbi:MULTISPECIES: response regulator transcription factor [Clostridium]|uniref:Stage 0 sporulation protein A homolog n=1 Tax=Clostridium botulinum (strain Eklund 17B / Type B) TaxID=935198 RepID=B2TRC2_CLOBB|nr:MULTISPECIES: response regulator transcription factor [Clostridium]ACD22532.1 alkaline phosphatase synthesis transcriptional regulatory protein PhoP [Clostridium botulinum B str. Eklund 17B (NRP)]MBY6977604.1 response regulator transcription factor [Clostridium botulinum]MBY7002393.1 response regulator transcription factor [Clostridium botulinum]MCR1275735.1 response regulator transcription factor [Clostridium botulinum]NFD71594.1 response regulator transcription factor [Clostridium botulin